MVCIRTLWYDKDKYLWKQSIPNSVLKVVATALDLVITTFTLLLLIHCPLSRIQLHHVCDRISHFKRG